MVVGQRAAIVTGASSGIGFAVARMLGERGYGLTLAGRRAEKLERVADELRSEGIEVESVSGDLAEEDVVRRVVASHSERFGRLDVLVNNAGLATAAPVDEIRAEQIDAQFDTNIRSIILFYRECIDLLRAAAAEHHNALVVNTASIAAKRGAAAIPVYAATKAAVVGWTLSMHDALAKEGIKSTALCPSLVDTAMSDPIKDLIPGESMIRPNDIAIAVAALIDMSPACVVPEIQMIRPDDPAAGS
jgi:short-subunit dehydrogenase